MKVVRIAKRYTHFIRGGVTLILLISAVVLLLGSAPHTFAQGFVPLAKIPGLNDVPVTGGGLATFFNNLYKYLIGVAAVLAVIEIVWGGLEISTKDSVSSKTDGKQRIYNAIFGLVLILSPVLVFSIINPSILNLSLNLPDLDTLAKQPPPAAVTGSCSTLTGSGAGPCIKQLQDQCTASGGTPVTDVSNSTAVRVTCNPKPSIAPGTTIITTAQCLTLTGVGIRTAAGAENYTGGDCSTTYPQQEVKAFTGLVCNSTSEGGACLYYPK